MALARLTADEVYRFKLANENAFVNWQAPTAAELNANATNQPNGLIYNLTCAINTDGSTFDLDDPTLDESLTFCQTSGDSSTIARSATVVWSIAQAKERWTDATQFTSGVGFNTSTLAQSLLLWRGTTYYAIMSIGKAGSANFAVGDRVSLVQVTTDWATPDIATGGNINLVQTFAKQSNINWNYKIAA